MGLAQKVEEEALAFSSDRSVYVYREGGKPACIARRQGRVKALAVYNGRLVDSGNYEGVRDTLTGQVIAGQDRRWNTLAVNLAVNAANLELTDEHLYGSVYRASEEDYGIWDINVGRIRFLRNGQTTVLFGGIENPLIDGGKYIKYLNGPEPDFELYCYDDSIGLFSLRQPCLAGVWMNNGHYIVADHRGGLKLEFIDPPIFVGRILDLSRMREADVVTSFAEVNGKIYFGTEIGFIGFLLKTGELSYGDERFNFEKVTDPLPYSLSAMTAVPIEVYDSGIGQEVSRRQYLRNTHASKARAVITRAA